MLGNCSLNRTCITNPSFGERWKTKFAQGVQVPLPVCATLDSKPEPRGMMEVTLAGALTSLAVGWWLGTSTAAVKRNPPNLQSLQERIMHAKNLSMRMEELFRK